MKTNYCRVCLSKEISNDITELENELKEETKTYADIILFCFDIVVNTNMNFSMKLCSKCYLKVIDFYKFKKLAIESDKYIKSTIEKNEIFVIDQNCNGQYDNYEFEVSKVDNPTIKIKTENDIEDSPGPYESDDELLSVLKKIKYEYLPEEQKDDLTHVESTPEKKKRGHKKKALTHSLHIKNEGTVCEECGKVVRDIKGHMLLHSNKKVLCKICNKTFSSYSARCKHIKYKHLGHRDPCKLCGKNVRNLQAHIKIIHNPESMKFDCQICGRKFISPSRLKEHVTVAHTKERPYTCDICDKSYSTKVIMMLHKRQVHEKERSHLCQICSKSFFKKYHLINHIRSHTKEKPYKCPSCDKCFSNSTCLKNHIDTHNEERNFACTLCHMTFTLQRYLDRHMLVHSKEKKYPCKYCGVCFTRSDHQKRHQRTAHERFLEVKDT